MYFRKIFVFFFFLAEFVIQQLVRAAHIAVFLNKEVEYFLAFQFLALLFAGRLYHCTEFGMHGLGHFKAEFLHNECRAAFARLAVDADNRLIFAADVGGVDRQIRDFPAVRMGFFHIGFALVDCVLMRPRKCGKDQFARIRMARTDMHFGGALVNIFDFVDVGKVEFAVHILCVHI